MPPPPPLSPGAPDQPFNLLFGATASPLLPSPPRAKPSVPSFLDGFSPPPDYNILFTERIAVADTDPYLRTGSRCRPTIDIIPRVREAEPTAPELPPEEQIRLSPMLRRVFPEAGDWFGEDDDNEEDTAQPEFTLPNYDQIRDVIIDGEIPPELEFFTGDRYQKLVDMVKSIWIDEDNREFLDNLPDKIYENLMQRNKITIHVETGSIYYDNTDIGESIYTFLAAQQDQTKKLMSEEFQFFNSYEEYIMNYMTAIENETDDELDMPTNKFLFYHFN